MNWVFEKTNIKLTSALSNFITNVIVNFESGNSICGKKTRVIYLIIAIIFIGIVMYIFNFIKTQMDLGNSQNKRFV